MYCTAQLVNSVCRFNTPQADPPIFGVFPNGIFQTTASSLIPNLQPISPQYQTDEQSTFENIRTEGQPSITFNNRDAPRRALPPLICDKPSCVSKTFGRQAELNRHYEQFHSQTSSDIYCPADDCNRNWIYGQDHPFSSARKDKLREHIRKVHRPDEQKLRSWFRLVDHM